jgi:hypothetical protein
MTRDEVRLRPPNHSYVDMLERLSDGLHVDVVDRQRPDGPRGSASGSASATARENNRRSSPSSRDEQD